MKKLELRTERSIIDRIEVPVYHIEGCEQPVAKTMFLRPQEDRWKSVIKYGFHLSPRRNRERIINGGFMSNVVFMFTCLTGSTMSCLYDLFYVHGTNEWDIWVIDLNGMDIRPDRNINLGFIDPNGVNIPVAIAAIGFDVNDSIMGFAEFDSFFKKEEENEDSWDLF